MFPANIYQSWHWQAQLATKEFKEMLPTKAKKKIMSVSSDKSKNIRIGRSEFFFFFLFFFKEVMTKLSDQFCFFYI